MVESKGSAREVVEKTSAINLLIAFAYATKNYLREEYSYEEEVGNLLAFWRQKYTYFASQMVITG
jgi:hypothetical protein